MHHYITIFNVSIYMITVICTSLGVYVCVYNMFVEHRPKLFILPAFSVLHFVAVDFQDTEMQVVIVGAGRADLVAQTKATLVGLVGESMRFVGNVLFCW